MLNINIWIFYSKKQSKNYINLYGLENTNLILNLVKIISGVNLCLLTKLWLV